MVIVTLCGALGAVLTATLAWAMLEQIGWRWFVGTCSVPAWIVLVVLLFVHDESPRFLFSIGHFQAGTQVLQRIAKQNNRKLTQSKY